MSQIHAPMTEEEWLELPTRTTEQVRAQTRVWHEAYGWCSACRDQNVPVVLMGLPDRYIGMCAVCIEMLKMELRAMGMSGTDREVWK